MNALAFTLPSATFPLRKSNIISVKREKHNHRNKRGGLVMGR